MDRSLAAPKQAETERAVLRTVLYSDIFDYPLTVDEIAHYLIGVASSAADVETSLTSPVWLNGQIARVEEYIAMRSRESLVRLRRERAHSSAQLWRRARIFARILSCLPFVRMVAVTGALAMDNSSADDDIDLMIVTAPGRVYLARAWVILVVYAGRLFGQRLCPNYVVSENALSLEPRNIYVAHEFVQMVPIYGAEVCTRMRAANRWVEAMLPNATAPYRAAPEYCPGSIGRAFKHLLERLLGGYIGDAIETWERQRKIRQFAPLLQHSGGNAIINQDQVKGHFNDHGERILRLYHQRLEEFQLIESPPPLT